MLFESIKAADNGGGEYYTLDLYGIEGMPGIWRRIPANRADDYNVATEVFWDGGMIMLVPAQAQLLELFEVGLRFQGMDQHDLLMGQHLKKATLFDQPAAQPPTDSAVPPKTEETDLVEFVADPPEPAAPPVEAPAVKSVPHYANDFARKQAGLPPAQPVVPPPAKKGKKKAAAKTRPNSDKPPAPPVEPDEGFELPEGNWDDDETPPPADGQLFPSLPPQKPSHMTDRF